VRRPPPGLGQHTAEVLEELGFDVDFVARLTQEDDR
jgi:crotonobetainyl-CoA:carnitine CoA-transferase CaiB-like acyl-CoA transferase